jgi:hypothetical protein
LVEQSAVFLVLHWTDQVVGEESGAEQRVGQISAKKIPAYDISSLQPALQKMEDIV